MFLLIDEHLPTPQYKTPPNGPADQSLYLALASIVDSERGRIDPDAGVVWLSFEGGARAVRLRLESLDELESLGWVDLASEHNAVRVTDRGRYWLKRFGRLNTGGSR